MRFKLFLRDNSKSQHGNTDKVSHRDKSHFESKFFTNLEQWFHFILTKSKRAQLGAKFSPIGTKKGPEMNFATLNKNFKQFLKQIHPDFFSRFPEKKQQNLKSVQQLNEILNLMKFNRQLPTNLDLRLNLRNGTSRNFKVIGNSYSRYFDELCKLMDIQNPETPNVKTRQEKKVKFGSIYRKTLY